MPENARGDRLEAERPLGIRLAALNPFYMVPVLGFASWTVSAVVGLGAAATTISRGLPREHAEPHATPDASSALASGDVRPVAPFASRLGAVVLDIILVTIVSALPDLEGGHVAATFLADHVVLWTRKRTTVGGIISQPGVTRTDGDAVLFIDALMRSLATIFRSRGETGSGSCGMRIGRLGTTRSRAPMWCGFRPIHPIPREVRNSILRVMPVPTRQRSVVHPLPRSPRDSLAIVGTLALFIGA